MPISPPDFASLFTEGMTFTDRPGPDGRPTRITVETIGTLSLPTGQVYACDPFIGLYGNEVEAFSVCVKPGSYLVQVARHWLTATNRRIAAARLVIRDEPVAAWELAVRPGQDVTELGDDAFFGYGVDAGAGCFIDVSAAPVFADLTENGDDGPVWDAFESADHVAVGAMVASPDDKHTIAVFSSGWGDGAYPTWVGRTAEGEVACFATEFFVVPDERDSDSDEPS